jgi:hypothetical protein
MLLLFGVASLAAERDVRPPRVGDDGRFWVYKDGKNNPRLPFIPYAWMPAESGKMMTLDLECQQNPHQEKQETAQEGQANPSPEPPMCIAVKVNWKTPWWVGVAFVSGPDDPQWWGEDDRGWYYDLSGLKKKKLVFYARGETGKERIQIKAGILGNKPYGDSLKFPAQTKWLKLPTEWTKFELDLSKFKPEDLKYICNGFTFVLSVDQQEDSNVSTTQFYLDTIYFE